MSEPEAQWGPTLWYIDGVVPVIAHAALEPSAASVTLAKITIE